MNRSFTLRFLSATSRAWTAPTDGTIVQFAAVNNNMLLTWDATEIYSNVGVPLADLDEDLSIAIASSSSIPVQLNIPINGGRKVFVAAKGVGTAFILFNDLS